jgi:hypothetical protein
MLAPQSVTADRFSRLAAKWKTERGPTSSITQMAMHPAYQEIIGMGREAIALLLRELEREPDHWFWALKSITGIEPVALDHRGNVQAMTEDWLHWASVQGYQW